VKKYLIMAGFLLSLSTGCQPSPTPSSRQPSAQPSTAHLLKQIPTRLNLLTSSGKFIQLKNGSIRLLKQGNPLLNLDFQGNRLEIPQQKEPARYSFEGEGVVEALLAVPIGGSQGGALPIPGSQGGAVPISGSQGGLTSGMRFQIQADSPEIQPGQRIAFKGEISQDISEALAELELNVPAQQVSIIQGNQYTGNGVQINNTGTVRDIHVHVGESNEPKGNHSPVIQAITANPSQTVKSGDVISLTVKVFDQDKDPLDYTWNATQGLLSATKGTLIT